MIFGGFVLEINSLDKVYKIMRVLDDKKALDIKTLYVSDLTTIADYFIIASGSSTTHVKSLCDEIRDKLMDENIIYDHIEGYKNGNWILMDYGDVVVHIFMKDVREFYSLDRLWADAKEIVLDKLI